MAAVIYRNTQIIPSPLVTISTDFERDEQGNKKFAKTIVDLHGTFVSYRGGLTTGAPPADLPFVEASGIAWLMEKQAELRDLFSVDDGTFTILGNQGQDLFSFNPKITGPIQFNEGVWVQTSEWTVGLSAITDGASGDFVKNEKESWQISENEENKSVEVVHSVSAVGETVTNTALNPLGLSAIEFARRWVLARTGYNRQDSRFVYLPGISNAFNYLKTENYDTEEASYAITETWTTCSGQNYIEEFEVTKSNDASDGYDTITINGTITGLRGSNNDHYGPASTAWNSIQNMLYSRCVIYGQPSGTLNPNPKTTTVTKNPDDGVITYTWSYNAKSSVTGAEEESIVVRDINPTDIYASVPIIARTKGPVLQNMNTVTSYRREIAIELKFDPKLYPTYASKTTIDNMVDANILVGLGLKPAGSRKTNYFVDDNQSSWDFENGKYTRNVAYTWNTGI